MIDKRSGRRRWRRIVPLVLAVPLAVLVLMGASGCDTNTATTSAAIGFVSGDGVDGRDAKLHKIVYPNQKANVGSGENIVYVPGNSRNYIINDGTVTGVGGNKLGDRHTPIVAYTSTGTPVKVSVSAFWTLNQSKPALEQFFEICFKYNCATNSQDAQGQNFAPSAGWNGMLAENFGPALDAVALQKMAGIGDDIWRKRDPKLYEQLGREMSASFADAIRARLGYSEDLFCGSGSSSGWADPNKPGTGTFTCGTVRIVVERVEAANADQAETASETQADKDRRARAVQLYGESDAGYFLGIQDAIRECKQAGQAANCTINVGEPPSRR